MPPNQAQVEAYLSSACAMLVSVLCSFPGPGMGEDVILCHRTT